MNSHSPLETALLLVSETVGIEMAALTKLVERVDAHHRRGITVELGASRANPSATRRWFKFKNSVLIELSPANDPALPLCSIPNSEKACISWRPGRRIVLAHSDPTKIQKGYRAGMLKAPQLAHELFHATTKKGALLRTPRVSSADQDLSALLLTRVQGSPIRIVSDASDFFCSLGEGLAVTQRELIGAPLPVFRVQDELQVLDSWHAKVQQASGQVPPMWLDLFEALTQAADSAQVDVLVGTHRDLHDGQLLDANGSPGLIDFDLACLADACLDPANLLAHLELRLLQGFPKVTRSSVNACSEALLEGLGGLQREAWPRLRFYQSSAFLRLALVYSLRPRWRHLATPLTTFAKRCLADLVHAS